MKLLAAICFLCLFAASPVRATIVSWNLDGDKTEGTTDFASHSSAEPLVAGSGYMVDWPSGSPLAPYYVNHGFDQSALEIVDPPSHQWQENKYFSAQIDVGFILSKGLTDVKLQVGSIQNLTNEPLAIWGTSNIGDSDVQTGGINNGTVDFVSANMANFANEKFTSIGALGAAAMPAAFQATLTPVPEMSALFPIVGLIAAIALTQILRRRRMAQLRATSSSPR
jgi:hypothetical protein